VSGLATKATVLQTEAALGVDYAAEMDPVPELIKPETIGHMEQFMNVVIGALEELDGLLERHRISGKHPFADLPHPLRHTARLSGFHTSPDGV